MKNLKVILLLFFAVALTMPAFAQKSVKKQAKETAEAVSKMDEKQQQMILNYTRNLQKVDTKKEMKRVMKKMSAADQQKVLDYIAKVTKAGNTNNNVNAAKAKAQAAQAQAKAKAKTPKTNAKPKTVKPNPGKAKAPATPVDPATLTQIEIIDKTFDFGTIPQGEKAAYTYKIKNVGNNPLLITKAKGSCGCTVPQWPKEAVQPGDIAEINVVFNSRGKKGKQNKRITITANTSPAQSFMTITGNVEVPAPVKN